MDVVESYIGILYNIYFYMILIYVLMSWVPSVRESFVGQLLGKLVEPYLSIFRRFIPAIGGVLDISPIVALIALRFIVLGIDAVLSMFFG
ncbi:YggT family protein [Cohnella zeiphila]|uniref:YggT family protein n=1 Tax=Cohnella zeiphila TaxID=2761120 RepID=A0A7X0SGN7_9BACL|nr:YggT family protein [Cohnella zeiphila]MBB6729631.1 YggT family protein [Cohnella zeiphila]